VVTDPGQSRSWKAYAVGLYRAELAARGIAAPLFGHGVAVAVELTAIFSCPRSQYRKREPRQSREHTGRPDVDNLLKAALDAGNGVLWMDDSQVSEAVVRKVVGAQEQPPLVVLTLRAMRESELPLTAPRTGAGAEEG
jgi:Holliday junction resolvase RusA-like endonuclease